MKPSEAQEALHWETKHNTQGHFDGTSCPWAKRPLINRSLLKEVYLLQKQNKQEAAAGTPVSEVQ